MTRTSQARRGLLAAGTAAAIASALMVTMTLQSATAEDRPRLDELDLTLTGGAYPAAYLERDSDGDGWTDWRELLEGTDPRDPASHPLATVVELVGPTAVVQSVAFPDRLAVIDVGLPKEITGQDLVSTLAPLLGLSADAKLREQLAGDVDTLVGTGVLEEILAAADKAHGHSDGPGRRSNGMDVSLIADGFSDHPTVSGGVTGQGHPWIAIDDGEGNAQRHVWGCDDIKSWVWQRSTDADGNEVVEMTFAVNGLVTHIVRTTRDASGRVIGQVEYDGEGKVVSQNGQPVASASAQPTAPAPSAGGSPSAGASPSGGSSPSGGASPSSATTPSATASDVVDPDAGSYGGGAGIPTAAEVEARLKFLSGIRSRYADRGPLAGTLLITAKPGVADPAEPECRDARCVVFVEVAAPRLGNVAGGDPVNPDWGGGPPKP